MERSSAVRYTYQDLQSIPWEVRRHEILDGKLYVTPSPRIAHQRVALTLGAMMDALARRHGLGSQTQRATCTASPTWPSRCSRRATAPTTRT